MKKEYFKYFSLLFPLFAVYIVSAYYPIGKNAGKEVPFRPPAYVFGIVWPILLLLIGYSWTLRPNLSKYYFLLSILLAIWAIIYNNSRLFAFFEILAIIILTLFMIFYKFKKYSSYALIPLVLWLCFASLLSYYSI